MMELIIVDVFMVVQITRSWGRMLWLMKSYQSKSMSDFIDKDIVLVLVLMVSRLDVLGHGLTMTHGWYNDMVVKHDC